MELINQHTKKIMEGCKIRALDAGLSFDDETLEYIVTNRDLIELSPKVMIPTLYDYWVHDVEVLKEKGKYELYPGNPYETVINTRPAISFYNDNNPDWLNVMIFYHVIGHIDFFQNNIFFKHTWDYDFTARALSDKRLIARLRSEKGRFVDYVIEFARSIDNVVGYHSELSMLSNPHKTKKEKRIDYYFDVFLQSEKKVSISDYIKEIEKYNGYKSRFRDAAEESFFSDIEKKHPEFETLFNKYLNKKSSKKIDVLQYLIDHSPFINKEENSWMKPVLEVIRTTSIFFQPQIRTKIMNEGWASYWHEKLFLADDRIKGHEVDFARVNAGVTAMPRVGLNPYALGMRMFYFLEEMGDKGKYSYDFQKIKDANERQEFDAHKGKGQEFIFNIRENFCDFTFINTFLDQDFMTRNKLFVAGKRLNKERMVYEYFVKSKKVNDYRKMIIDVLYHPPYIEIDETKSKNGSLYLNHLFEGKPLVNEYIANTMMGIEYLLGAPVHLETSEVTLSAAGPAAPFLLPGIPVPPPPQPDEAQEQIISWQRVLYTMDKKKLTKKKL
ncbi:MAG: SpoVR family protein [Proteobacteria bacterium]|nr:SpoVR family protein [Pseudomonadota bacterium]